ncbi:MAG TPA: radical SAM family heme chaperone HemW [Terriglobales bacterium]|jgi:oxygen-independent coproporphyrinogen-3 oxidase|nr:radical SAM family heme chaperone HemW [Terriglobales bacterium]
MPLGLYVSVPFCRSKCSFCNFASGVFSRDKMSGYIGRLQQEIAGAEALAESLDAKFERTVDSIYLGGGTPTTLAPDQLASIFQAIRNEFDVQADAEITVECAPGTLSPEILEAMLNGGTNRVSLGTQSFVDEEIKSVGRLHTAQQTLAEITALRAAGINSINVDLIAGLPHQTTQTWRTSLEQLVESGVPHASVYILEIDEDSRLGRELIAGGERYHAHHVPDSDLAADLYLEAIDFLNGAGLPQYEISNFARLGCESRHNLKYWTRQPYLGLGLDAHSMLFASKTSPKFEAVRFANTEDLPAYFADSSKPETTFVDHQGAGEETMFLGLRLNRGIDLNAEPAVAQCFKREIDELRDLGLLEQSGTSLRLTSRGRLLSNEVFERFIAVPAAVAAG